MEAATWIGFIMISLVGYLVLTSAAKECTKDSQCPGYCGSDFSCHDFPENPVIVNKHYTRPALIIGASIIIAAVILKWKRNRTLPQHGYLYQ